MTDPKKPVPPYDDPSKPPEPMPEPVPEDPGEDKKMPEGDFPMPAGDE